jgi:hypothetical protein
MTKHVTVRYDGSRHSVITRYVHKYYLSPELKCRIFPVDIEGIETCLANDAKCNLWDGWIPEKVSACVIHYQDLGLEKSIEGDTVRRVLEAYAAYHNDCQAKLTPNEIRAAMNLNEWLMDWEQQLLSRCIELTETMEQRVRSGDVWLCDYEMNLEVGFYVRDDDPFSEGNNPDASTGDVDCDAALLCEAMSLERIVISAAEAGKEDYWGIGDRKDHNDRHGLCDNPVYQTRHCLTFHELSEHLHVPMKHMGRIGHVFADIVIRHQNGIRVDLMGERAVAVRDSPRIRDWIMNSTPAS